MSASLCITRQRKHIPHRDADIYEVPPLVIGPVSHNATKLPPLDVGRQLVWQQHGRRGLLRLGLDNLGAIGERRGLLLRPIRRRDDDGLLYPLPERAGQESKAEAAKYEAANRVISAP